MAVSAEGDRLRRLEDRLDIQQLQARYAIAIDDQDLDRVAELFASEGRFCCADGVMDASGREAVCEQFRGRFAAPRYGFHVTHDHIVELDPDDPDRATGIVSSHAEVVREGRPMIAAMRYADSYVRQDGASRFADRCIRFFYYLPVDEYHAALPTRGRMRAYGDVRLADLPEGSRHFSAGR